MNRLAAREALRRGIVGVAVLGVVALLLAQAGPLRGYWKSAMLTASTGFVLAGMASGGFASRYGRLTLAGLVFCWLGDVLGPVNFLYGLSAFLVAHLFFIGAFAGRGVARRPWLAALAGVAPVSLALVAVLYPRMPGGERFAAIAYAAVISGMVAFAGGASGRPGGRLALLAAVLFYVSDISVALWHFVGGSFPYGYTCYPLYYGACLLFAWQAGSDAHKPRAQEMSVSEHGSAGASPSRPA